MAKHGKFRVEKFNGHNYQLWKMQMENYLYQKYLYIPLGGKANKPMSMMDKEWDILDTKGTRNNTVMSSGVGSF